MKKEDVFASESHIKATNALNFNCVSILHLKNVLCLRGICKFGADKCWYSHKNNDKYAYQEKSNNQEIFDKLFQMMEKMTDRILYIENKNEKTNEFEK